MQIHEDELSLAQRYTASLPSSYLTKNQTDQVIRHGQGLQVQLHYFTRRLLTREQRDPLMADRLFQFPKLVDWLRRETVRFMDDPSSGPRSPKSIPLRPRSTPNIGPNTGRNTG